MQKFPAHFARFTNAHARMNNQNAASEHLKFRKILFFFDENAKLVATAADKSPDYCKIDRTTLLNFCFAILRTKSAEVRI